MKVYLVMESVDYEGDAVRKVFANEADAVAYMNQLIIDEGVTEDSGYTFYVLEQEVN